VKKVGIGRRKVVACRRFFVEGFGEGRGRSLWELGRTISSGGMKERSFAAVELRWEMKMGKERGKKGE
jgi:hypothetical protein